MTSVQDDNQSEEVLGRLEPDKADRVLGVRLPLDGNMVPEFEYRCQQVRKLSNKVFNAPISHWDAWLIYESRYRAMIRYPLPVTMFSTKQCIQIQRPFIHAVLPKMGMNRTMPRVIVFGPKALGGLEMMDLRIEQIAIQWNTTMGHLRRLDRAGKGLHITAHDLQVELGTSVPFYELNPDIYNYATKLTRWSYLWSCTHELNLKIELFNFWTPRLARANDRNIMDVAMSDKVLTSSRWKMIHHINQCRLYLKAFNLSDLSTDGVTIGNDFLNGTSRGSNRLIKVPNTRRPTKNQWSLWKSFLFRIFLSLGSRINPPLGSLVNQGIHKELQLPLSEIDTFLAQPVEGHSISDIVELLPTQLRCLLGTLVMPDDEGLAVSEGIVEGICMGASDGSLMKNFRSTKGAHGYALSVRHIDDSVTGFGTSPESDRMSSLTSESYGLLGLLITLHVICKKYKLCKSECFGEIKVVIDNKTVVAQGRAGQEIINLSDYNVPDQDLWSLLTELMKKLPVDVRLEWVRGHQNQNKKGEVIFGPFPREVEMNILVDGLASRGMQQGVRGPRRPTFSSTVISVYDGEGVHISDMRRYITETVNGKRLIEFMMMKRGWSEEVIRSIEWEGIEGVLRRAHPIRRGRVVKMLHNWQNTGSQKKNFRASRHGQSAPAYGGRDALRIVPRGLQ